VRGDVLLDLTANPLTAWRRTAQSHDSLAAANETSMGAELKNETALEGWTVRGYSSTHEWDES